MRDIDVQRKALGTEWLDVRDAARALNVEVRNLTDNLGTLVTRESRSLGGRGARCVGYAYKRYDIERCAAIMEALGCRAFLAMNIFRGIRELEVRGMLAEMTLNDPPDGAPKVRAKRKRQ